jgi:hypothetical protein
MIRRKDLRIIGIYTLATAALTLALVAPRVLDAQQSAAVEVKVAIPRLVVNEVSLFGQIHLPEHSETQVSLIRPSVRVIAASTAQTPVEIECVVSLNSTAPSNRMSRVMPMPATLWSEPVRITLAPGESRTVELEPQVNVAAGSNLQLLLSANGQSMVAVRMTVPPHPLSAAADELVPLQLRAQQ